MKFGRNKKKVAVILGSEQAANLRANTDLMNASTTGWALSSMITGLNNVALSNGLVTNIFGVDIYEAPFCPAGEAVLFLRSSPIIGDRRMIKIKSEEIIKSDQRRFVISERIDFKVAYVEALCRLHTLSEIVGT